MAQKRLSQKEKLELKDFCLQGITPSAIAAHFGVSVSTVHNIKKDFEDQGITFPSVRGKRDQSNINLLVRKTTDISSADPGQSAHDPTYPETLSNSEATEEQETAQKTVNLNFNGVFIQLDAGAIVRIQKGTIDITF